MCRVGRGMLAVARGIWLGVRWACMGAVAVWAAGMLLAVTFSAVILPLSLIIHWRETMTGRNGWLAIVVLTFMGLLFGGIAYLGWRGLYQVLLEWQQGRKRRRAIRQWQKWSKENSEAAAALLRRMHRTWYDGLQEQDLSN